MLNEIAVVHQEIEHSPLGASSCERWWNCPGSINLMIKHNALGGGKTSFDAAQGTAAHLVASTILEKELGFRDDTPNTKVGSVHEVAGHRIVVDDEMLDAVQFYVEAILARVKVNNLDQWQCQVEQRIGCETDPPLRFPLRGTADNRNYIPYVKLYVDDYKHGVNPVKIDGNYQLLQYIYMAVMSLPEDERLELPLVEGNIFQPRLIGTDGSGGVATFEMSVPDLLKWGEELKARARATEAPDAPRVAGSWCQYCPVKMQCDAYTGRQDEVFEADFKDVRSDLPSQWSNEKLAYIQDRASEIKKALDEVQQLIYDKLQNGEQVGEYKLVAKRSNRVWRDPADAAATLGPLLGADIFETPTIKTVAQMETLIKRRKSMAKANKRLGKEVKDFNPPDLSELWVKPDNGYTIAREGDSRVKKLSNPEMIEADFADL